MPSVLLLSFQKFTHACRRTHLPYSKPPAIPYTPSINNTGCNEASEAEQLLAKAQRVFSQFDPEEGGFIQGGDLRQGRYKKGSVCSC